MSLINVPNTAHTYMLTPTYGAYSISTNIFYGIENKNKALCKVKYILCKLLLLYDIFLKNIGHKNKSSRKVKIKY